MGARPNRPVYMTGRFSFFQITLKPKLNLSWSLFMTVNNGDESINNDEPNTNAIKREPIFNLPSIILVFAGALTFIHLIRVTLLSQQDNFAVILSLAFIPASYGPLSSSLPLPMSWAWSPITYGLLHSNWQHLFINLLWMAAFGAPVAKRLGVNRFLILTLMATFCGALLHYIFFMGSMMPMLGASGAVSGYMGAAARFAFNNMGKGGFQVDGPALNLLESFTNRQFMVFFLIWMITNYLFGSGLVPVVGEEVSIAWQAHVGGFLAGIFGFSLLDRKIKA